MGKNVKDVISIQKDITIGEKVFKFKSLTLKGLAEFQLWCDTKKKKEVLEVYALAGKEVDIKEVMEISGDDEYYNKVMQTIEGISQLIYIVIKCNNEDVDEDYVKDNLSIEDLQTFANDILGDLEAEPKPAKNIKARAPKKK